MRKLTNYDNIKYTIECLPEVIPIKGNAMASGDPEEDRRTEDWIQTELDSGNEYAWCVMKVTAEFKGYRGVDYLGCCSYTSRFDFMQSDYLNDMKDQALQDLNNTLAKIVNDSKELESVLND